MVNTMPKIARFPGQKSQFVPTIALDTYTITVKRDSIHPFQQNRIYQTLKMSFNHPSSSKNNAGVITNHHFATLPNLQPEHDGDSHKQEIPAKSIQFVTTSNASSNCSCSRPHQRFFHFSEKHDVSSLKCIGFPGR